MNKKNLVIVRAGDSSLHENWLESSSSDSRSWDLFVSYYGATPKKWARDDILYTEYQGGKGDGIYDMFSTRPDLLDRYDYIMIADDDFDMSAQNLNRLFEIMREYDLQIAQPVLSYRSFTYYFPTFYNPEFKIRWVNFTQDGYCCLSHKVWRQILPLLENNPMAMFIDNFWNQLTDDPQTQCAMIDEVIITHTRPCGGELWQNYHNLAVESGPVQYTIPNHSPDWDAWGLTRITTHQAILKNGKKIKGKWRILPHLIKGWLKIAKQITSAQMAENRDIAMCVKRSIHNHLRARASMAKSYVIIHGKSALHAFYQEKP